jgi:parallel beta-helix repeat protein
MIMKSPLSVAGRVRTAKSCRAVFTGLLLICTALPSQAAKLVVPTQFPTIQSAVDAASPGDTIQLLPGTYAEQVTIGKNLKVVGVGFGAATIQAPTSVNPNSFGVTYIVQVNNAAQVSMSRVVVSGPGPGACSSLTLGISVYGDASLELKDSVVAHIRDSPLSSCNFGGGVGIGVPRFLGGGSVGHAVIKNSLFFDYQSEAIGVVGTGSTATISNNLIVGSGNLLVRQQNGILVTSKAVATITGNIIGGNLCDVPDFCGDNPSGQGQSAGVFADNAGPGTVISGNFIAGNDVGIYIFRGSSCCTTAANVVKDNRFFGLILQDGDNTVSDNKVSGGETGIGVVADFVNVTGTLVHNTITQTTLQPVLTQSCCGVQAIAIIQ